MKKLLSRKIMMNCCRVRSADVMKLFISGMKPLMVPGGKYSAVVVLLRLIPAMHKTEMLLVICGIKEIISRKLAYRLHRGYLMQPYSRSQALGNAE